MSEQKAGKQAGPQSEIVEVRVIPRAKKDEIAGVRDGKILVRTVAPPVDGKANKAVRKLVAAHLGVPERHLQIVRGEKSRDKTLKVSA